MTFEEFKSSLSSERPPEALGSAGQGLWWDAKGDWIKAHESAQQDEGMHGAWVHAYLHRKEEDQANAEYWYGRAGKAFSQIAFGEEWEQITKALLEQGIL